MQRTVKILVVDDSAMIREFLRQVLDAEPDLCVVGTAADPYFARDKIKQLEPDVLTLDIEMPRMDGLTFLEKLMASRPMPVVMFSKVTQQGAEATLKALGLGAVEVVSKPMANLSETLPGLAQEIVAKVRAAARAKLGRGAPVAAAPAAEPSLSLGGYKPAPDMVVVIGASTGGTVALEQVLGALPEDSPPLAIVQHLPAQFTKPFANRLNQRSAITVSQAEDHQPLEPGTALIAPGGRHLLLERGLHGFYTRVKDGPLVNQHKPSVDVLFRSAAASAAGRAVGVIMTGMGSDGAQGAGLMRQARGLVIAQDEASSVIYGMARAAVETGQADMVLPLERVAAVITRLWKQARAGAEV
ncbi:MAG: chemotaxis response regulator protein-glutamate methylesterase [Desulfarculaceae bacterium]|nr:chemotaxis response regulator protein-glutamate methylesterase [Desulfarculaceae bacterium]MCF8072330.1 chemotaxis response regulator protein-glutamate methylesterase [Desulfarculaceae bacterium]MCF8100251.1 chemotaxis response regulator protein-glutamate methylesterase [Desulfarculaceae bacterium]